MKNTLLVAMLILSGEYAYSTEYTPKSEEIAIYLVDEYQNYSNTEELLPAEQEYTQYVCDELKPLKPSAITALFTNIGCTLLVYYVSLKTKAKHFLDQFIKKMNQLVYAYVQKRKA